MYYQWYELTHAALSPARAIADATRLYYKNPLNPMTHTGLGRSVAAAMELFERMTRRYGKPEFGIASVISGGTRVAVREEVVWRRPFCNLIHFSKIMPNGKPPGPKLLIVAPMSGHYATLLRGTVEDMLSNHDVYITDWMDARMVPLDEGRFDLDDYIDYIISILHFLGGDTNVMAVCQPSVPVLAAVAVMEGRDDPYSPQSMILMGGPIDTRCNPTAVNKLAESRDIDWFRRNVVMTVPWPHPGFMREVYPGFLQLSGFMGMNLDRHVEAHKEMFQHLVEGDGDSAEKHREFYDEYLAVMDLTAEFYLQTVETIFIDHALPKGEMMHRGTVVDPSKIRNCALMTVEGERDDISGLGQTRAAHNLCTNIPEDRKVHYMQPRVGHYGVFNGSRFRAEIAPRISDFVLSAQPRNRIARPIVKAVPAPASGAAETPVKQDKLPTEVPAAKTNGAALADDLTRIAGIGPKLASLLKSKGIEHFTQIAALDEAAVAKLDSELNFKGRISRDKWVAQARRLVENT